MAISKMSMLPWWPSLLLLWILMQDLSASQFQEELLLKTRELFPTLASAELSPFLPHSRATSAYDAVTLMARAWASVLTRNETCSNSSLLQSTLTGSLVCVLHGIIDLCTSLASFPGSPPTSLETGLHASLESLAWCPPTFQWYNTACDL